MYISICHRILLFIVIMFFSGTLSARKKDGWKTSSGVSEKYQTPIGHIYKFNKLSNLLFSYKERNESNDEKKVRKRFRGQFYRLYTSIPKNKSDQRYLVIRFKARLYPGKDGAPQEKDLLCHCFFSDDEKCSDTTDISFYMKLLRTQGLPTTHAVGNRMIDNCLKWNLSLINDKELRYYEEYRANWHAPGNYEIKNIKIVIDREQDVISVNINGRKTISESFIDFRKLDLRSFGIAWFWDGKTIPTNINMPILMELSPPFIELTDELSQEEVKPQKYPYSSYVNNLKKYRNKAEGSYAVGLAYFNGDAGYRQNYYRAVKHFRKAGGSDRHPLARYMLGICSLFGLGGKDKDIDRAISQLKKSADMGYAPASALAALLITRYELPKERNVFRISRCKTQIARLLKDAVPQLDTNIYIAGGIVGEQIKTDKNKLNTKIRVKEKDESIKYGNVWVYGKETSYRIPLLKPYYIYNFNDIEKAKYHFLDIRCKLSKKNPRVDKVHLEILQQLAGRYPPGNYLYALLLLNHRYRDYDPKKASSLLKKILKLKYGPSIMAYLRTKGLLGTLCEKDFDPAVCCCLYDKPEFFLLKQCIPYQKTECAKACFEEDWKFLEQALDSEDVPFKAFAQAYCMLFCDALKQEPGKGAQKLIAVAAKGNPEAQYLAAMIFDKGIGIIPNFNKFVNYLEKAAAQKLPAACLKLYHVYLTRKFDQKKAFSSLKIPCSHNIPEAWYYVGEMLYGRQKYKKAIACWRKAAELGYIYAYYRLGISYFNGVPGVITRNNGKASAYWKKFHQAFFKKLDTCPDELLFNDQPYPRKLYDKNDLPFGWRIGKAVYSVKAECSKKNEILGYTTKVYLKLKPSDYYTENRNAEIVKKFFDSI